MVPSKRVNSTASLLGTFIPRALTYSSGSTPTTERQLPSPSQDNFLADMVNLKETNNHIEVLLKNINHCNEHFAWFKRQRREEDVADHGSMEKLKKAAQKQRDKDREAKKSDDDSKVFFE